MEPRPVASPHDFHAHAEACCRSTIESELKRLRASGQLPDLAAEQPGVDPRAVGAIPGLGVLAGLLAGPLVHRIEAQVLKQAEAMAENFAVTEAQKLFPGVDVTIVQQGMQQVFAYVTAALTGAAPAPSPVS